MYIDIYVHIYSTKADKFYCDKCCSLQVYMYIDIYIHIYINKTYIYTCI